MGDSDRKEKQIGKNNQTHDKISLGWAAFGKLIQVSKSNKPICLNTKVY